MFRKLAKLVITSLVLISLSAISEPAHSSGSTVPYFSLDGSKTSAMTLSGSSVSAISEIANSVSGTPSSLNYDSTSQSLTFSSSSIDFGTTVKPAVTNGVSIQIVAKFNNNWTGGSWPRVFDIGDSFGGNDISVQIDQTGNLTFYMWKSGVSGSYNCGTTSSQIDTTQLTMYSFAITSSGGCTMAVNGGTVASTNNNSTNPYSARVLDITNTTWYSRIGTLVTSTTQSPISGNIRNIIVSTGVSNANSVVYVSNGGTGYTAPQTSTTSANLSSNQFTKTGATFTGWNTKADGSGTSYAAGTSYNFSSSIMLYAQWNMSTTITPTISSSSYVIGTTAPTVGYGTSPSVSLTTPPTCSIYSATDGSYSTPITLNGSTPAGNYVAHCSGGALTGYTINYGTDPTLTASRLVMLLSSNGSPQKLANTNLTLTINTSGTFTFYESGVPISHCINLSGASPNLTCPWKPRRQGGIALNVSGQLPGMQANSNVLYVAVGKRSGPR